MLAKRVIPCLDVHEGRVVKGTNFVNLRDAGDPVQIAQRYELEGADELVFLDITASHVNSTACKNPDFVRQASERFGAQCIVVNIDPKRVLRNGKEFWEVHINGGRTPTGLEAVEWARTVEALGAGEIVLTSMDRDGTKDGYDLPITAAVSDAVQIPVVASGGAGHPLHLIQAIQTGHADAVLAASIFHFGEFTIQETKRLMAEHGIPVRL